MRHFIPILFAVAMVLAGCQSTSTVHTPIAAQSVAATPPFTPMLMTLPGTNTSADGTWRFGVSEHSLDLSHCAAPPGRGWSTTGFGTASPWTAHAGWFVFAENESRAWAYDGDESLILQTYEKTANNETQCSYDHLFPCAVPVEVLSRLPKRKQKEIGTIK